MGKKRGTAPVNAEELQEELNQSMETEQPGIVDMEPATEESDLVIISGTGTGLLNLGQDYSCSKETADFHIARGYATLKTI